MQTPKPIRGRGTTDNPPNRFDQITFERDPEATAEDVEERPSPRTQFLRDTTSSLITYNDSPDIGFSASINVYRGCEHGCIYCYARPYHEYLGFSAGLDFETKIVVKENAPELLRRELLSKKWKPQPLGMSGVTDCYQPIERKLKLTRRCLEVLLEFRNPVGIVTKNYLVTRDIDLLSELAKFKAVTVWISITTLDAALARAMEPRTAQPNRRLQAVEALSQAGIPVGVLVAPVIPGLTDHELPSILKASADSGASSAGYVPLRLPGVTKELFPQWLEQHFPNRKEKVLAQVRAIRGGKLNDPRFGKRMEGEGIFAEQMEALFQTACRRLGLNQSREGLSTAAFRRPDGPQLNLF